MKIALQPLVLGGPPIQPTYLELTLEEFFILNAHDFQESPRYPYVREGREGGCQFAFDRDPYAVIYCIDCKKNPCDCDRSKRVNAPRFALQRFTQTQICILDVDLNTEQHDKIALHRKNWPPHRINEWCKYHALLWREEQELRRMEDVLTQLSHVCFFYRTKCNGFRIGFETLRPIQDLNEYKTTYNRCKSTVKLGLSAFDFDKWFHFDPIGECGQAYWSYPRVHQPVWLNRDRTIK